MSNMDLPNNTIETLPESNEVIPSIAPTAEIASQSEILQPQSVINATKDEAPSSIPEIKLVRSDMPVTSLGFPFVKGTSEDDRVAILSDKVRGEQIPSVAA